MFLVQHGYRHNDVIDGGTKRRQIFLQLSRCGNHRRCLLNLVRAGRLVTRSGRHLGSVCALVRGGLLSSLSRRHTGGDVAQTVRPLRGRGIRHALILRFLLLPDHARWKHNRH